MTDIFTDLYNTACRMLGINQPVQSSSNCQERIMQKSIHEGSTGVPFNTDNATSVNRNIMGTAHGSMQYDTSLKFSTDGTGTIKKRSPTLINNYDKRVVDGTLFN